MANHLITFGHGNKDTGTTYNGITERDEVRRLLPYLQKWAKVSKHKISFYNGDMYADRSMAKQKGYASVTELHLDGPKGDGGHVIIHKSFKPDAADNRLRDLIKRNFGIVGYLQGANGYSYRSDLLNLNVAAKSGIAYRLLELFFLSNDADRNHYRLNIDRIAKEMIQAITGETLSGSANTPTNKSISFDQVVTNTYKGLYGNGNDRKNALSKLGFNANDVQKAVNKKYY